MKTYRKQIQKYFALAARWSIFCLLVNPSLAFSHERLLFVFSNTSNVSRNFISTIESSSSGEIMFNHANYSEIDKDSINQYSIIVAVGIRAARELSKYKTKASVVYALIPDNELLQVGIKCNNQKCYKVFLNQPVKRYIKLFKNLFPQQRRLVFATTDNDSAVSQTIKDLSGHNNISYKEIKIKENHSISRILERELRDNDVLLALPDAKIYNASNARSIILSSYHANVPIISYSKSFAKAGAMIGLYSGIDELAKTTSNVITAIATDSPITEKEIYLDNYAIKINRAVARSLNIDIDSENDLKRKMK